MKTELAIRLIADQMDWDDAEAYEEFAYLKLMSDYKFDHYQGFQSGARFYLALMGWLSQFETIDERKVAYAFLKTNLIFISQREMHHLVSQLMPIIDRNIRKEVAKELSIPLFKTWLEESAINKITLRRMRTLFIGLSDGARIDVFRRYNEGLISNEQVVAASEISEGKWSDLLKNLKEALAAKGFQNEEPDFERICLIDDFTGSGSSLIRFDPKKNQWKGKIQRFFEQYSPRYSAQSQIKRLPVQIHHHLASAKACIQIKQDLAEFATQQDIFEFSPSYSYILPQEIVIDKNSDTALVNLLIKYYNKDIEDNHTGGNIWFGYRNSGLPLVLDHNTPNNSIALLWATTAVDKSIESPIMKPLFIRRKRHSSHG